jgi:hypothetical protein
VIAARAGIPHRLLVLGLLLLSWLGLWYHEVIRVPASRGLTAEGSGPMLLVAAASYALWLRPQSARLGSRLLLAYGLLMLIGGFLSAPPWAVFHLVAQAERTHYQAHVVYALCQLPLVVVLLVDFRRIRQAQSAI